MRQSIEPPPLSPAISVTGATPAATMLYNANNEKSAVDGFGNEESAVLSEADARTFTSSPKAQSIALSPVQSRSSAIHTSPRPHLQFALPEDQDDFRMRRRNTVVRSAGPPFGPRRRNATILTPTAHGHGDTQNGRKYEGNGGFPGPLELLHRFIKRASPGAYSKIQRKMTMPYTSTLSGSEKPYLNFDINVGRNSDFHTETLSDQEVEDIGGVEYMALRVLSYLVPAVSEYVQNSRETIYACVISHHVTVLCRHTTRGIPAFRPMALSKLNIRRDF